MKILIAIALFIDSFLSSFLQVFILGLILLTQANILRLGLWLGKVECSAQVALYSERSHCTFTSQYLAIQHLYRLELIDVGSRSNILSGIFSVYNHSVVAFSR